MKNKLKAKKGTIALILLTMVIAFTMGNTTHDPLTDLKNRTMIGLAAATGKVDVYPKGAVSQVVVQQGQVVADEAAQEATSPAKLKQIYQASIHYNPSTGVVESSLAK